MGANVAIHFMEIIEYHQDISAEVFKITTGYKLQRNLYRNPRRNSWNKLFVKLSEKSSRHVLEQHLQKFLFNSVGTWKINSGRKLQEISRESMEKLQQEFSNLSKYAKLPPMILSKNFSRKELSHELRLEFISEFLRGFLQVIQGNSCKDFLGKP